MSGALLGVGHYLPSLADCAGVRRPRALEPGGPSTLAVPAAEAALSRAALTAEDVDFIVFATMTPDVTFPGSACYLQPQLGARKIGALDVRAQCAGFVFGLVVADRLVQAGKYRRVLVAGAEVHSAGLDYSPTGADVARLYGDGAGVAIVGPSAGSAGILATAVHTDGSRYRDFWCEYPASRQHPLRVSVENFRAGGHFPKLDKAAVRRFGEASLPAVIGEVLAAAGLRAEAVDRFVVGHVLSEVGEAVGRSIGARASQLNIPAARYGHLSAAALPVALSEEIAAGTLGGGAVVCLAASGAGAAWGAAVIRL
ncbi:3-oxoacyl-ACP synthase III family protein [Candidatus Binatia bacterium]|nr:3-oxoacyl-ACP synthase III family protein [Candidatus Binatia bacterium]